MMTLLKESGIDIYAVSSITFNTLLIFDTELLEDEILIYGESITVFEGEFKN
jgi:hypothetical protein